MFLIFTNPSYQDIVDVRCYREAPLQTRKRSPAQQCHRANMKQRRVNELRKQCYSKGIGITVTDVYQTAIAFE